ncbi:hypothetical protein, partial [Pseudomonas sp. BN417]|uniref:hypothetical protein n=1 Tax=Pseudomonas sp. BN417 TaxID=2567890 RepID=UPI0024574556
WSEGSLAKPDGDAEFRMQGQAFLVSFLWAAFRRLKKETRREAKQKLAAHSISNSAQDVLATLNADIAKSFAKQAEGLPRSI